MYTLPRIRKQKLAGVVLAGTLLFASCSADASTIDTANTANSTATNAVASTSEATTVSVIDSSVFDTSMIHDISVDVETHDLTAAIAAYMATGDKEWVEVSLTIDGITYEQVGLRLKGNSSLRGISIDDDPASLPWLIRFDKYIDDQTHLGYVDLVIRSNTSESALNEAVALDLLAAAGLASEQAVHTNLSFNGGASEVRLMIEHPDDVWMEATLAANGALYKAESTGDYSYRGDDPDSYDEVFDQEAGKDNTDLTPLIEFLDFINNADDATFENELANHLDVDAFATYLAMMDLVDNFDDIDGPGNNSYLYYNIDTDLFTVVPWDLNLAFGARNDDAGGGGVGRGAIGGGGAPGAAQVQPDADFVRPDRGDQGAVGGGAIGGGGGNGPGGSNVLAERFQSTASFAALYQAALTDLQAELFDSGLAADLLAQRVAVLDGADTLLDSTVLASEAAALAAALV